MVYGDELLQTAEDSIEMIWRRYGLAGLVRLLLDLVVCVPAEHLAELRRDIHYGLRMLARSPGFTGPRRGSQRFRPVLIGWRSPPARPARAGVLLCAGAPIHPHRSGGDPPAGVNGRADCRFR